MSRHPVPEEALKESIAVIGRVGSGKTYATKTMVEAVLAAQGRVCIIDPTGVWWGLRLNADGKKSAFPVVIFGGDHADVAITEQSAGPLAVMIASQHLSAIVDLADFKVGERVRFMTAFLDALYMENRGTLTLVMDEADMFAPQRPMPDQTVLFNRVEQICRRGRVRGFRTWLITQRPAELSKSVLSQANTLVAMQLNAPQDRDAVGAWIEGQADRDEGKKVLADLPKLKKGEGYVWSPSHDVLAKVKFPAIKTFDSSRTPEEGESVRKVTLAAIDLTAIRTELGKLTELVEDDDPKVMRKLIADLRAEIDALRAAPAQVIDPDAESRGMALALADVRDAWADFELQILNAVGDVRRNVELWRDSLSGLIVKAKVREAVTRPAPVIESSRIIPAKPRATPSGLTKVAAAFLGVLAQLHPKSCTRKRLSIMSGYSSTSSQFGITLKALRYAGFMEGERDDLRITPQGMRAVGAVAEPLPKGQALIGYWISKVSKSEGAMLQFIASKWPRAVTKEQLSQATGYSQTSSGFGIALGGLRKLELIEAGEIRASDDFFQ